METDERFEKFRTSQQPGIKLSIAAEDYFLEELPEKYRAAYGAYLQQRIRPAVELLIQNEGTEELEKLWSLGCIPVRQMDDFLLLASRKHKNAAFAWLLQKKQESCGFSPRDFSL